MGRERLAIKNNLIIAVGLKKDSSAAVLELCEFMIDSLRELNDTASGAEVIHNQGEIAAYKFLSESIINGAVKGRVMDLPPLPTR